MPSCARHACGRLPSVLWLEVVASGAVPVPVPGYAIAAAAVVVAVVVVAAAAAEMAL